MRVFPLRVSVKDSIVLVLLVIFNTIQITDMANNDVTAQAKQSIKPKSESSSSKKGAHLTNYSENDDYLKSCPTVDKPLTPNCSSLQYPCILCGPHNVSNIDCQYGSPTNYSCKIRENVACNDRHGDKFNKTAMCRFCYQTEKWEHRCEQKANCNSVASPSKYYLTNCTVNDDIICFGKRKFLKKVHCSWTAGTRWGTALILALTLGGFGADRFYLGHWQEGIGKLFSFGGLGVWTLVDALLIGIHHLGPADGSLYI